MKSYIRKASTGFILLCAVLMLSIDTSRAESVRSGDAGPADESLEFSGPTPATVETRIGEVTEIPQKSVFGSDEVTTAASDECHRQEVTFRYNDSSKKPFIKFTGIKKWCYGGGRVTRGTMEVQTWIRPDLRYRRGQDGYRYVDSALKDTDRFLTYKGHRNGAHRSVRVGRFEYRAHGFPRAGQVLNPYVSRTGRYDGSCVGPKPRDASPKVSAVKPASGAKSVSPSANIEAAFSRAMKAGTIDKNTFFLTKKGSGRYVKARIRYNAAERRATFDPARRLPAGTYTATVFSGPFGALTVEGDPLMADKTWSFTVRR